MLEVGSLLDKRYAITGQLGQGGMSYVFRARDQFLDRDVAIKFLRPHLTETDRERFLREIKTLARLNHPGIVAIYELGQNLGDSDQVYFAMELIEGGLFTDLGPLEPDPEPFRMLLEGAISVAETLDYVHRLGIVHRDLTPRNILLSMHNFPKVMDFGLVQLAEATRQLTRTGLTLGTPHYMAPEQAKGDAVDAHTDLYAFGAVLYRALTGITPFDADNDQAVLYQHVYAELVPAVEHNPYIPKALSKLVERLLSKDPRSRPSSGLVVAEALRSILTEGLGGATHQRLGGPAQQGTYAAGPVNPASLKPSWHLKLEEGPQWPGALSAAEGFIFIGLRNETIRALRPADGSLEATFQTSDEVNTAPLFHRDHLVVLSRDGSLSLLKWPSGRTLWSEPLDAVGVTPYGEGLVVGSRNNALESRSLKNELLWHYDTESPLLTPPVIHRGHVYGVTQEGWVHALEAVNGGGKFKFELGAVAATPAAKDGLLLLPERSGDLHAFDTETRQILWTYDLEGQIWASPVCWRNYVYAVSWSNILYCVSLKTGDDIWSYPVPAHVTATPVVAAGVLYLVTEGGHLLALDAQTGKSLFETEVTLGPIQASPLILNDTVVVAALDGTVKAYRTDF